MMKLPNIIERYWVRVHGWAIDSTFGDGAWDVIGWARHSVMMPGTLLNYRRRWSLDAGLTFVFAFSKRDYLNDGSIYLVKILYGRRQRLFTTKMHIPIALFISFASFPPSNLIYLYYSSSVWHLFRHHGYLYHFSSVQTLFHHQTAYTYNTLILFFTIKPNIPISLSIGLASFSPPNCIYL